MKEDMSNWIFPIKEKFKLSENFLEVYKNKEPNWGPIGWVVYKRSYSKEIIEENRSEEWWETCKRVVEGCYTVQLNHCKKNKLPWNAYKSQKSAQEMYDKMFNFKWLPPGRGLANFGTDVIYEKGSAYLFNCSAITTKYIDKSFSDPFMFMMDFSMCGVGVSFDTEGSGKITFVEPKISDEIFVIEDSREGWVSTIYKVLESFVGKESYPKEFDYSQIRPFGAPIKKSGGRAPGPEPLKNFINNVTKYLYKNVGKTITSTNIVDIMNMIGVAVVAGGRRRTAQLSLGKKDDIEYLNLKNPELYSEELLSHRWASNNSISAEVGMKYNGIIDLIASNGEPGLVYLDLLRNYGRMKDGYKEGIDGQVTCVNPCGEIGLSGGNGAGGELCNICEIFPSLHESLEELKRTIKYAYLYCKTITLIPTHNEYTNSIILKNRRIGISMAGVIDAMVKHNTSKFFSWVDECYSYLTQLDKKYSEWLCIQNSIKLTTTKPGGSTPLLPGVSSGVTYPHSKYLIRRIRFSKTEKILDKIIEAGYKYEKSKYNDNTIVVEFPIETPNFKYSKNDVSIFEQMEVIAKMQELWSDNSISNTITFKSEEKNKIKFALELFEGRLKTVTLLPLKDHSYVQAPLEEITKEQYEEMIKNIKPINSSEIGITTNKDEQENNKFCDGESCVF